MLYAQEPRVLMITGYDDDDNDTNESLESTFTMLLQGPRPPIIAGLTLQTMRRNLWFYDAEQIADQEVYKLIHPVNYEDHNDGEDARSRDIIDEPTFSLVHLWYHCQLNDDFQLWYRCHCHKRI